MLFTDQCLHQHHYLRHYTKQVVARSSPNIGFCQKLKRYLKVPGRKLLDSTALNTPEREINLLDNFQKCSISFVINETDLKADINIACIQNNMP